MSQCLDTLFTRCSIRWFKQDPLPLSTVVKLLEAATRAPTAQGAEQWFFIVVYSEEKRKEVHRLLRKAHEYYATSVLLKPYSGEAVVKWMKRIDEGMYRAPVYIAVYADLRKRIYKDEYYEYEKLMAVQSVSAAIENLIIAAWSMGIGSVWLGVPVFLKEDFNRVLNPPENCDLQAIVALGYPAEEPKPRRRKPVEEVVAFT
ncbi:MAG: nitroreductase family protein [Desulfurococcaceae archaeon]